MPYTKEQIQSRYDKLPDDIKQAMNSVDTTNAVVDIGQKYDLMYDQISELVDEVGLTMIGLTPEKMFVNNIARRMQVDMSKAMLITQDINKQVFDKMRESLKKIEGAGEEGNNGGNSNAEQKNNQFGQDAVKHELGDDSTKSSAESPGRHTGEKTFITDSENAQKESVVSAIERAGGFVIDKQGSAPLQAEGIVRDNIKKNIESNKNIINVFDIKNSEPAAKIESSVQTDHPLGNAPSPSGNNIIDSHLHDNDKNKTVLPDQFSIVDTLLSKGVAMPINSNSSQNSNVLEEQKTAKIKPYDGTDPYREPVE